MRDKLYIMFGYLVILVFIGLAVIVFIEDNKPQPKAKNEQWCSEIIFFNAHIKKMDTTYSASVFNDDSLVSFTDPVGKTWFQKEIVSLKTDSIDDYQVNDITTNNGSHFVVIPISDSLCLSKKQMDSIRNNN